MTPPRGTVYSNIPVPDPSAITTDQINRAKVELRDEYKFAISALDEVLRTRLDAMDKATILSNNNIASIPTGVDRQVAHLSDLHEEKFTSIQKQFDERDIRSQASENAAKVAVNAALQAQKEAASAQNDANAAAITKSEAATVKQIDGILALLASNTKAIDEKIASINGRLDRGEGGDTTHKNNQTTLLAVAALFVSIIVGGFAIVRSVGGSAGPTEIVQLPSH
jgi:hypothetical protein